MTVIRFMIAKGRKPAGYYRWCGLDEDDKVRLVLERWRQLVAVFAAVDETFFDWNVLPAHAGVLAGVPVVVELRLVGLSEAYDFNPLGWTGEGQ